MFSVVRDVKSVRFTLASDPTFVQPLIRRFEEIAREWGVDNAGRIVIVLRELLSNAIVHGNHSQPSRLVHCWIKWMPEGRFRIVVQDEGSGFDFGCLDTSIPEDPRKVHQRGYILIRNLCQHIEFNQYGNRVTVQVDASGGNGDF